MQYVQNGVGLQFASLWDVSVVNGTEILSWRKSEDSSLELTASHLSPINAKRVGRLISLKLKEPKKLNN